MCNTCTSAWARSKKQVIMGYGTLKILCLKSLAVYSELHTHICNSLQPWQQAPGKITFPDLRHSLNESAKKEQDTDPVKSWREVQDAPARTDASLFFTCLNPSSFQCLFQHIQFPNSPTNAFALTWLRHITSGRLSYSGIAPSNVKQGKSELP